MARDRTKYLDHLERWLNYEEDLLSPPLDDDAMAQKPVPTTKPTGIVMRNRIDSFVGEECVKNALDVVKESEANGVTKSKCITELGKATRITVIPLPSCARDENDEGYAGSSFVPPSNETIMQKVKNVLGMGSTSKQS